MNDVTVQIMVLAGIGLILLAGFFYMFDDFFGGKKKKKTNLEVKEPNQI